MAKQSETNKSEYFKYLEFAEEFVKKQMKPFSSDDVKSEYLKNHLKPENHNVFSSVFVALSKKGAIKFNGNFEKKGFQKKP